jgi:hypothetical protein
MSKRGFYRDSRSLIEEEFNSVKKDRASVFVWPTSLACKAPLP